MEYEVLKPGYKLMPHYALSNQEGVLLFVAIDQDPTWQQHPRPPGRYVSTGWIPGNLLAEGMMVIGAVMRTLAPPRVHYNERDAVAFQVVDSTDGNSARGAWTGRMPGVVRPLLEWHTQFNPNEHKAAVTETEQGDVDGEQAEPRDAI
jgi:lipopolysaccharide transport system ATP-binding protein